MVSLIERTNNVKDSFLDCPRTDVKQVGIVLNELDSIVSLLIDAIRTEYLEASQDDSCAGLLHSLQRVATPWLVSLMSRYCDASVTEADRCDLVPIISKVTSMLCGRFATGPCVTQWQFDNTGSYDVLETTYTEAEIGFQTWGGGILLAQMIDSQSIDVSNKSVLELGCGTGLAGLVSARAGSAITVLSDYHPVVLQNAQRNVDENGLNSTARVVKLDWIRVLSPEDRQQLKSLYDLHNRTNELLNIAFNENGDEDETVGTEPLDTILTDTRFDLVIAADCIFDHSHSLMVPKIAKEFVSKSRSPGDARFHVILPHRVRFRSEIEAFEENMPKEGWILEHSEWFEKATINFRYYVFSLPLSS